MKSSIPFKINHVYQEEVARLLSSRIKSKLIHASGDIDASGDEVEAPFRDLLKRRLPSQYFVGHGHIVDKSLNVSPQFDVIIADNNATPILFEAENGCQYFPWESVYAVGEVKAKYEKSKHPIETFSENIAKLKTQLTRTPTLRNYLGNGISLGEGFTSSDKRSLRNPLLQFIVFFDSGNMTQQSITDEYYGKADENLPVVSLFLDGKVVVKAELKDGVKGIEMGAIDLDPLRVIERKDINWMLINYTSTEERGAQALVVLMLGLFDHLNSCVLMTPRINDYLETIMSGAAYEPRPASMGAVFKMLSLSCKEFSEANRNALEKLFEFRALKGKSLLKKWTSREAMEVEQFLKESGIESKDIMFPLPKLNDDGSFSTE